MATESDALDQKAAAELQVEIIPGTEVMTDVHGVRFAHAGGKESGSVLVPHPTNDLHDPLNWSRPWKYATAFTQLLYVWVLVCSALSIAPLFPLLGAYFHIGDQQLSLLTGVNVITLGFANILIVPLSNIFGRRPISIVFGFLVVLTNIWQALATSHTSFLAFRACNGLVAATSETIMVQVIADMFFLHERGTWMGLYFIFYFSGAFLGPIMSGNIAARHGWRSFFWLTVALAAFVTVLLIFFFPETKWRRDTANHAGVKDEETNTKTQKATVESEVSSQDLAGGAVVGGGKPSRAQYSLIQKIDPNWVRYIVRDLTTPVIVFFNPIVFWAALMLAGPADLLLLFNLTESPLFSSPAYRFNPGQVGYTNFAFFVGGIVGVATAGPFSDWLARRSTIRNNGIREAEMRLPALIPFVCFFIISNIVGAIGYQRLWPWEAIVVCGFGFSGLAVTSIPAISIAYAVDCYKPIAGEIMVVATVMKNVLGFCLSYWIFNLAQREGFLTVYMVQFAVDMLPVVLTIPLYLYGKKLRAWTRNSHIHRRDALL
ncbi:major facilitator superfamily domain-containing protein [Neohortaea acidophila]|uniref:Major facilitator superfamily domain-containing protein n=1 Tax=Neohortaea acidophila TaxID=245834 RepID=A0A6A6Q1Y7_9PEZI|nr:major facilitator superfamily domain-containing protein [Neohortaea acidophila]KAF2485683.1 major facilitator superfamily domain-containing protein [Neohortaea acidophila]